MRRPGRGRLAQAKRLWGAMAMLYFKLAYSLGKELCSTKVTTNLPGSSMKIQAEVDIGTWSDCGMAGEDWNPQIRDVA